MKTFCYHILLISLIALLNNTFCKAQDEILITGVPESFPGAMDGQMTLTVQNAGNNPGQNPPPFTFKLDLAGENLTTIENSTGIATFTGLGYKYYTITIIMGNGCSGSASFYFDGKCTSGCLVADFNFEYNYDGCTVFFEDWSESGSNSWQWDFGDGGTSNEQDPTHIYSESGCYIVELTVSNGTQTRTLTKQVCITGCNGNGPSSPECHINGPTVAGAGQTIVLSGAPTGTGPFEYDWISFDFDPFPSSQAASISVTLPEPGEDDNGTEYNFSLVVTDVNGYPSSPCTHIVTLSGNIPDVEVAAFGSFKPKPNNPLVLAAFVDIFNLTGPEQYYFTIKKNGIDLVDIPGSCLNTWQNGDWDCTLLDGLEEGNYLVCVDVKDAIGTYSDCTPITIGSPPDIPPSPHMWLEVKYPDNPVTDPNTGHYVKKSGEPFFIGINGDHPYPGWGNCFVPDPNNPHPLQDEYYIVLHIKNLTTNDVFDVGNPINGQPENLFTFPYGLDWEYFIGLACDKGTLQITADVYSVACPKQLPDLDEPGVLYSITEPLYIDLYPFAPKITDVTVDYSLCSQPITVNLTSGCSIETYEWHVYDPYSNEEITGFFAGNTNSATVTPDLNHAFFAQFQSGDIAKVRCDVTVVDVNGFTSELSSVIKLRVPLRLNIPSTIYRCPGAESTFNDGPLASGGMLASYTFTWTNNLVGDNPTFIAPQQGSATYQVTVTDGTCSLSQSITVVARALNLDLPQNQSACETNSSRVIGPVNLQDLGGSGSFGFEWTPTTYLSDAASPNPVVEIPANQTIIYTLTVTDLTSECTISDVVSVTGYVNDVVVELPEDITICFGEELFIDGEALPTNQPPAWPPSPPINNLLMFQWTSDHPRPEYLLPIIGQPDLTFNNLAAKYSGTYNIKLKATHNHTGCYAEDDIKITVRESWGHTGYESKIKWAIAGNSYPVWEAFSDNEITSHPNPEIYSSAADLDISWHPIEPTGIIKNGGNIHAQVPRNGMFTPTVQNPYTVMNVYDVNTGCSKEYKSMRYIIVDAQPDVWVKSDKHSICVGDEQCFDIVFDMHVSNYQTSLLPQSVLAECTFRPPSSLDNPLQQTEKKVTIELVLVNGFGLYKGRICDNEYFKQPTTHSSPQINPYSLVIEIISNTIMPTCTNGMDVCIDGSANSIWIEVFEPANLSSKTTCTLTSGHFYTIDLGVPPCPDGTTMSSGYRKNIVAGEYIEIHPEAGIEIFATEPGGEGHHFFISDCIMPMRPAIKDVETSDSVSYFEQKNNQNANLSTLVTQENLLMDVYPNPFTGKVSIRYLIEAEQASDVTLNMLDFTGKLIQTIQNGYDTPPGYYEIEYDGGHLPPGVYLYQLIVENKGQITKKAVKIGF